MVLRHWMGAGGNLSDSLDGPPEGDRLTQLVGGFLFPIAVVGVSIWGFFAARTTLGCFCVFLSCFLHFHYFWGLSKYWIGISTIGKNASAGGMVLCIGYTCYRFAEAFV